MYIFFFIAGSVCVGLGGVAAFGEPDEPPTNTNNTAHMFQTHRYKTPTHTHKRIETSSTLVTLL